jgi:BirA family biotin operon repressor/biotin-[acetyl-CoA-carboxylase] ligase
MKDELILKLLKEVAGNYVSGEEISKRAGISRAAIWKHIERFREEGYEIEATPHLGYRLITVPDNLIPAEIKWDLATKILGREIISYKRIGSTNAAAYELAQKGLKEGAVVLAEEQTKGRGRLGRSWASPYRCGIYLSCILRPEMSLGEVPKLTIAASVSVAKAIRELTGLQAVIKWPNDILLDSKKVCGILLEMMAEQDRLGFVVVGIGVNVNTARNLLPKGATSLKEELGEDVSRIRLTQKILENLEREYKRLSKGAFEEIAAEWKELSEMLGARVKVELPTREFEGQAIDLDSSGSLLVRLDNGFIEKTSSGDVVLVRRKE